MPARETQMRTPTLPALAVAILFLPLLATAGAPTQAGDSPPLAVDGYDVVAYFTRGEAVRGSAAHTAAWQGREWRFANARHRRLFRAHPERYAPAYEGHCAWAMSQGRLADGRAQFWAIHEGRLFFNCNAEVHERWLENREALIEAADREWTRRQAD